MKNKNINEIKWKNEFERLLKYKIIKKGDIKFQISNLKKLFFNLNLIIVYVCLFLLSKKGYIKKENIILHNNEILLSKNSSFNNSFKKTKFIIDKYKRSSIIYPLPKEIKFKPWMSKKELIAFSYLMKPENIYFEFGSGGSTNLASYYKVKTYSVESDAKWHEKLKNNGIIANYITIDLKVNGLGYPGNETNIKDWKKYIQAYKIEYNADIILIDGRFRVACALDIFPKIRNDTIVLIHDYGPRKQYHILEKFYLKLKSYDNLSLFIKNSKVNFIPVDIYNFYLNEKLI